MAKRKRKFSNIQRKPKVLWVSNSTVPKTDGQHNYEIKTKAITALMLATGQIKPGEVYHDVIYHDDWCGIYFDKRCNCDPDIKIMTDDEYKTKYKTKYK